MHPKPSSPFEENQRGIRVTEQSRRRPRVRECCYVRPHWFIRWRNWRRGGGWRTRCLLHQGRDTCLDWGSSAVDVYHFKKYFWVGADFLSRSWQTGFPVQKTRLNVFISWSFTKSTDLDSESALLIFRVGLTEVRGQEETAVEPTMHV